LYFLLFLDIVQFYLRATKIGIKGRSAAACPFLPLQKSKIFVRLSKTEGFFPAPWRGAQAFGEKTEGFFPAPFKNRRFLNSRFAIGDSERTGIQKSKIFVALFLQSPMEIE
jgi:hypothetical protein